MDINVQLRKDQMTITGQYRRNLLRFYRGLGFPSEPREGSRARTRRGPVLVFPPRSLRCRGGAGGRV